MITNDVNDYNAKSLARSRILSWCVQGNKWGKHWTYGIKTNFLSYPLQWC